MSMRIVYVCVMVCVRERGREREIEKVVRTTLSPHPKLITLWISVGIKGYMQIRIGYRANFFRGGNDINI